MDAVTNVPQPVNEPVHDYTPGSPERAELTGRLEEMATERVELTMAIGGEHRLGAGKHIDVVQPHNRKALLGTLGDATAVDVRQAVDAAKAAAPAWQAMSFDDRASIFLKAADLLTGPWRATLNAATMLGQSKTCYQAEIDAACELADFWRFNVGFARADPAAAAGQRTGRVEPAGPPPVGGLRTGHHAVQLHRDRRQPVDRTRADGQHGGLEAGADPAAVGPLHDATARGVRGCRPAWSTWSPGAGRPSVRSRSPIRR